MELNQITERVIGACIEIHRALGPGLLESAYEECLCYELSESGLAFVRQQPIPLVYKGVRLDCGYRLDVVVESAVVLELKCVDALMPIQRCSGAYLPEAGEIALRTITELQRAAHERWDPEID